MKFQPRFSSAVKQRGSTLLVAVVLLVLSSVMALSVMNVGVLEQRSSGNDLRAKLVHQAAEAGLAQGFEYLFRANPGQLDQFANWELCGASDATFPCGAVDASIRGKMFRLKASTTRYKDTTAQTLAAALANYMLPSQQYDLKMGGFEIAYGVAPLLCRVGSPVGTEAINCSTDLSTATLSDRRVVTFVSVAQIRGDSGRTTLTQTVSRSSLLAQPNNVPSVTASGSVGAPGSGTVVSMPDAAGPGLDISIWSRLSVDTNAGSFGTCSRQEFLSSKGVKLTDAAWIDSRTCKNCGCPTINSDGWDILDRDGEAAGGINKDVNMYLSTTGQIDFPEDLFEYIFGVPVWEDVNKDGFAEKRRAKVKFKAPDGVEYDLYPDEAFLYQNATKIVYSAANASLVREDQKLTGNLGASNSGLIWCQVACLPNNAVVGSVTAPVLVVADTGNGGGDSQLHATVFGLLFYRTTGDGPLDPTKGTSSTGGVGIKVNGTSGVYGALVVQGEIQTGSAGVMFGDPDILKNLASLPSMSQFNTLGGGWTDKNSY